MRRTAQELQEIIGRIAADLEGTDQHDRIQRAYVLASSLVSKVEFVHAALDRMIMPVVDDQPAAPVVTLSAAGMDRPAAVDRSTARSSA